MLVLPQPGAARQDHRRLGAAGKGRGRHDPAAERPAPRRPRLWKACQPWWCKSLGPPPWAATWTLSAALRAFITRIPPKPSTDRQFKQCRRLQPRLSKRLRKHWHRPRKAPCPKSAMWKTCRTADLKNLARTTRLATEKLVMEKEARRTAIVTVAQAELDQHIQALNQRLGANWLPCVAGGFGEVIKGKKSRTPWKTPWPWPLTSAKAEMSALAECLEANRATCADGDWIASVCRLSRYRGR